MNNRQLDEILKLAPAPEPEGQYWEHFAERVMARLRERDACPDQGEQRSAGGGACAPLPLSLRGGGPFGLRLGPNLPTLGAALAVCVALALAVSFWQGWRSRPAVDSPEVARKCFQEIQPLFPHQLQAIVFDRQGARLVLAETADVPVSPPLYLKICGPKGCQQFVTFSGQQIRVNGEVCDVLLDSQGNVLVVGGQLVWSSSKPAGKAGSYRIEAKLLITES